MADEIERKWTRGPWEAIPWGIERADCFAVVRRGERHATNDNPFHDPRFPQMEKALAALLRAHPQTEQQEGR